jgi:hypothetical protein
LVKSLFLIFAQRSAMFINKIRRKESGILLYGITPPKETTPLEKVQAIAERNVATLSSVDIDALVVYDVQDESARTSEERPFPFASALDPFQYSRDHLQKLDIPKIIYRPAGKYTQAELHQWLGGLKEEQFHPVFVGLPCPDFVVKTSLKEAYDIWRASHSDHCLMGAVMIPERHSVLKDEEVRILEKVSSGVSYFISQCVFEVEYAKEVLRDLTRACEERGVEIPTMIFTLTICGSAKTLQFMEWLGIYVPGHIKVELQESENQVRRSVEIATRIAMELIHFCRERSIPFGFNIESVAIRKEEIDASLELLSTVRDMLVKHSLRAEAAKSGSLNSNSVVL